VRLEGPIVEAQPGADLADPLGEVFDRILVTAGSPGIPEALKSQLAESGRLVIPVGPEGHQHLTIVNRVGQQYEVEERDACVFVPLIGSQGWRP